MTLNTNQINIRDPYVVPLLEQSKYLMTGTHGATTWEGTGLGFDFYLSADLEIWEGPFPAFRPEPDFWGTINHWAPEIHYFNNQWYLFASFKSDGVPRGTQIFRAGTVTGPFIPFTEGPQTPADWECLDGTLYIDDDHTPWMVFCHEWVQVQDGEICAIQLSEDLSHAVSEPVLLFRATEAPWVTSHQPGNYVTDGPFLMRLQDGNLVMIWSSFRNGSYALGTAISTTGKITGPWEQSNSPLFEKDGGHGMLFTTFTGQLMLSLHQPNDTPNERPVFVPVEVSGGNLKILT